MDDEFWEGLLSGIEFEADEREAALSQARRARRTEWNQDAAREAILNVARLSAKMLPFMGDVIEAIDGLSLAIEKELVGMALPLLWADENEGSVAEFLGVVRGHHGEMLPALSRLVLEHGMTLLLLEKARERLGHVPLPDMGRPIDEWLLLSEHELYRAGVLTAAMLSTGVVADNIPASLAEIAGRVIRVYRAMAALVDELIREWVIQSA